MGVARGQSPRLILRPLTVGDEAVVREAQTVMAADGFEFAVDLADTMVWRDYLALLARIEHGPDRPADRVPGSLLLATVDGVVVGRTSLRYELNDWLHLRGGHIGYAVLPEHRRRGYATQILEQSLVRVHASGVGSILITCDDDNTGSRTVIERCGGALDPDCPFVDLDTTPRRRYRIEVPARTAQSA